ncbi:MAG: rhodanese-like domain-containing protein [Chloroflexi bacterium]|nr:rhodanese-like domain-containing protein [Chloroflexota bacterium]
MRVGKLVRSIFLLTLHLVFFSTVACTVPTPTPAALDIKAILDRYLQNLPDGWGTITPEALSKQLETSKPFLVDVREPKEIADAGFIANSMNIPIRTFVKNLDRLPAKNQPIVLICSSGHRSALAMEALQLLGYSNVKSLVGGISAWKAANLPVATGAPLEGKAGQALDVDPQLLAALDKYFAKLPDGWNLMTPAVLNDILKNSQPFQLEVREVKEIADAGSIAYSTNIPIRTLIHNLDQLPPDRGAPIIVECGNGHKSAMSMMALNLLGYTNTKSLAGGLSAWTKAGLPVSK